MTGMTGSDSGNVMATPGSHQFTCGGLADAFLVKFDPSGFRQWGTYYGGAGGDGGVSVCTDAFGSVYISGYTDSAGTQLPSYTGIATSGCHQSSFGGMADAFVVKFDGNGNRQWGTYYGGNGEEFGRNVSTDGSGNVFLTGETTSTNAIATAGSHQSSNLFLYNMEAFLVKFNTNGVRQWGTYYGIAAIGYSTCADFNGNVYLSGCSYLADSISTPGAFQTNFGGSSGSSTDAFLVKFNSNGVRQWGTLYGGNGDDYAFSCTYDPNNNVLITGSTGSNNIIATNNSFQNVLGGLYDAFAAKFDTNGNRIWGTFYGGNGGDEANDICIDPAGNIYLSGVSYSTNGNSIATTGCYQESFGGGLRDLFLVKLKECVEIDSISMIKPTCGNDNGSISITLNLGIGPYNIQWSNGDFGLTADSLAPGQYVVQITDANGCYLSKSINLNPSNGPSVTATSQNNVTCNGGSNGSVALTISGGANPIGILWSNGATTSSISNLPAGVYDAVITDASGCIVNASYNVTEPNPIAVSFSTTPASCGINDGSLSVTVTGGTSPYTYQWSANAASQTTSTASNLGNGIYSLNITDNANCAFAASGIVNTSSSGPSLSFSVTPSGGCGGSAQGSIDLTPNGGATPYNFQWSNGASSEDISGLSPGTYSVIVTGGDGCSSSDTVSVSNASGNINPELCIVSVDPISSTNKVIWEKPGSANGIKEYKIYREGSALNVYNLIKILPFDSVSEYTDPVANPAVRAWRYKISFKDSCGVETVLSPNHKTIHLAVNVGINNTRNLAWDAYEGFSFPTFNIWRYHASTGWVKLDSLPSNLYSYTDLNPPGGGTLDYAIEVERTVPCNSTRTLITTSRSNVKNIVAPLTTGINDSQVESFGIYPNPAKNNFTIDVSVKTKSELIVRLLDVRGRELRKEKRMLNTGKNQELISVEELASGIYLLELELNNQVLRAKLVKEE
jgi:hypothetical protein